MRGDEERARAAGCDGYVTKPYSANTLAYMMRYVMKQEVALGAGNFRPAAPLAAQR